MRAPAPDDAARFASRGRRMTGDRHSGNYRFGPFLLQSRERRLLHDGVLVPLEPRAFDLLATLVANAGSLVTKDELLERIWTGRVVEESNLHVHISTLRKAVGKRAIATVPRHGYRFTAAVEAFAVPSAIAAEERHNLPQPLASFVGREDDLAQLQDRLGEARLVTLSGIGEAARRGSRSSSPSASRPRFRMGCGSSISGRWPNPSVSPTRSRRASASAKSATRPSPGR